MIQDISGQRVHIRTADRGTKFWGRVIDMTATTEPVDITRGPDAFKLGERPDVARVMMPGHTSVLLVIEVELPTAVKPVRCRCDVLGPNTPEHEASPLCISLRPDGPRS